MQTDIRFPIGLLFSIIGIILALYGLLTDGAEMYAHSLNININLYSGVCLMIFGAGMLVPALLAQRKQKAATSENV